MKVHFIAIGGSAMHNLAIALHKKGFEVTGSDDLIFEPSVSRLAKHGLLPKEYGWYPEKITTDLDAVILGMHARTDNPELLAAQQAGLKIYSYPEYIYEQSKDKLRVVIGGSHGKTSITSMILHALQAAGQAFDYLVGAQLEGFDTMVGLSDAPLMIIEGDEYLSSPIDRRPKFHLYQANLAVISGIAWDHINVFPTFENYIEQFATFIDTMVPNGTLFYAGNDDVLKKVIADDESTIKKYPYYAPDYEVNNGITTVLISGEKYELQVFGEHNLFNLEAARNICNQLGITTADFYNSVRSFKGAARRLELLGKSDSTNIYKDFAHSPSKLKATIHAVKTQFPDRKLIACMELHTFSSLNKNFLGEYAGCMDEADTAIIFIHSETFFHKKMQPYEESFVRSTIRRQDLIYFDQPEKLKKYLEEQELIETSLLLMSSGNFGGLDLTALTEKLLG